MSRPWYEICIEQDGQIRDVEVSGNLEGAKRCVENLKTGWPNFGMIFIRQHCHGAKGTFRVMHKLTVKRGLHAT